MKKYKLIINGEQYETKVVEYKDNYAKVNVNGVDYEIDIEPEKSSKKDIGKHAPASPEITPVPAGKKEKVTSTPPKEGSVVAPIPGTILDIKVKTGDKVSADDVVVILEAMKMESEVQAGTNGVVKEIKVSKGDSVQDSDILMEIGAE